VSLRSLCSEPVTLLQRLDAGAEDEYGSPTYADDRVATFAYIEPPIRQQFEDTASMEQASSEVRIYLAPDVAPTAYDAIERADGRVYEIVGPPGEQMRGWPPLLQHYEVRARVVV
jgi:hypothetical protein